MNGRFSFWRTCRLAAVLFTAGRVLCVVLLLSVSAKHVEAQPIPPEVQSSVNQWPLPNKDYANTRADFVSPISSKNVHLLSELWSFELAAPAPLDLFGNAASNPLILNDTVYFQDLQSNVFAIDINTGAAKWERSIGSPLVGPSGIAVGWGKVFAQKGEKSMMALDSATGAELWSVDLSRSRGEGITIQPTVYDGSVYMSTVPVTLAGIFEGLTGYLPGATGVIHALDQETGASRWSFDTVDSADIWGNPAVNSGGGAWYPPAIDVNRGTTYWGIGNPAPWPGTAEFPNGTSRPGANLYTNSIVALDHADGGLDWFNQVKSHDLFDHDFQISPILATLAVEGVNRDLLIGAGKNGTVVGFDRQTGETLWTARVGIHENDELESIPPGQTVRVTPGDLGGVMTPMAYADGVVYAPVSNHPSDYTSSSSSTPLTAADSSGELVAIDASNGNLLWNTVFDNTIALGGATVVNDLVFTSTIDGMVYALDRLTGEQLWSFQAPAGINAWPAVAGDTIIIPMGFSTPGVKPQLIALRIVPEPSSVALLLGGLITVGMRIRRERYT